MKIVVLGNDKAKNELLGSSNEGNLSIMHVSDVLAFELHDDADAFFDLNFELNTERIEILKKFVSKPVFINAVSYTIAEIDPSLIRINGWNSFLKRNLLEAACMNELLKLKAGEVMNALNKTIEWVPDVKGFISARVVSMVINEAYFSLDENVSTKNEIDTAMKLGTNYPYGPFEWSELIGLKNIHELLTELSRTNSRYQPAALLQKEASH